MPDPNVAARRREYQTMAKTWINEEGKTVVEFESREGMAQWLKENIPPCEHDHARYWKSYEDGIYRLYCAICDEYLNQETFAPDRVGVAFWVDKEIVKEYGLWMKAV